MPTAAETVIESIETEVALLLRRAEATRRADPSAANLIDRAAYVILRQLDVNGDTNVSALAVLLGLDGSTVTRQVAAMERDDLVARRPDPADGRGTLVVVTPHGHAQLSLVSRARSELYERVLSSWSTQDRTLLATMLRRLNESLDAEAHAR